MALMDVLGRRLVLTTEVLAEVRALAEARYPEEACGFLAGPLEPRELVDSCRPVPNAWDRLHQLDPARFPGSSQQHHAMMPGELLPLLQDPGSHLKVLFHSHPDGGGDPSEEDLREALLDGIATYPVQHLILGLRGGQVQEMVLHDLAARRSFTLWSRSGGQEGP